MDIFQRLVKRRHGEDKESEDAEEEQVVHLIMVPGPPYRCSDEEPDQSARVEEIPFIVGFRTRDGIDFTLQLLAVVEVSSGQAMTDAVRGRIVDSLKQGLSRAGPPNLATELLAVIRDFVRVVCLGSRGIPTEVLKALDGRTLKEVRVFKVITDSGSDRSFVIKF